MGRAGFHERRTEPCPDCNLENRLNILCLPAWNRERALRETFGCETCDGSGRVPVSKQADPYDTGRGVFTLPAAGSS